MAELSLSMRGLIDAVERLAGACTLEDVVEVVRSTARKLIGADGIAVILRDGENCHYVEEDAIGPLWKGRRFPMSICISGWAMLNRQTVVIPDVLKDPRIPTELYEATFVRSLTMAPVRVEAPIAAIGAYWSEQREPSAEEVERLEALARATATALENIRLIDALSKALSEAQLARDELRHRVKNAFSAVQSLAVLSLPSEQAEVMSTRIAALARAHDLLDHKLEFEETITVGELLGAELDAYRHADSIRISLSGPRLALDGKYAVALGLVVNELATNALKHGALSTPHGIVTVSWREEDRHLILEWRESNGPEIRAQVIENYGSRLLRRLVEDQLHGTIRRTLARAGAVCTLEIPLGRLNLARPKEMPVEIHEKQGYARA